MKQVLMHISDIVPLWLCSFSVASMNIIKTFMLVPESLPFTHAYDLDAYELHNLHAFIDISA